MERMHTLDGVNATERQTTAGAIALFLVGACLDIVGINTESARLMSAGNAFEWAGVGTFILASAVHAVARRHPETLES